MDVEIYSIEIQMTDSMTDEELYNAMKDLPDFDCYPIPQSWFKKFNLPVRNPITVREYIESGYAMKMAVAPKDLPTLVINEPQQNGKLVKMVEEEPVKVDLISRPFELKEGEMFPAVLPSLKDPELLLQSLVREDNEPQKECPDNERSFDTSGET